MSPELHPYIFTREESLEMLLADIRRIMGKGYFTITEYSMVGQYYNIILEAVEDGFRG